MAPDVEISWLTILRMLRMVSFCARCLLLLRWLSSPAVHQVRVLRFAQKNETVNCVMLTLAASLDIAVSPLLLLLCLCCQLKGWMVQMFMLFMLTIVVIVFAAFVYNVERGCVSLFDAACACTNRVVTVISTHLWVATCGLANLSGRRSSLSLKPCG